MNNEEINIALKTLADKCDVAASIGRCGKVKNLGVFPSNHLPNCTEILTPGSFMIVNTDPVESKGTHWLALYCPARNVIEVFDSYGYSLDTYPVVKSFLIDRCRPKLLKTMEGSAVQEESADTCGAHCIFYLAKRILDKISMERIIGNIYSDNANLNDCLVLHYLIDHIYLYY